MQQIAISATDLIIGASLHLGFGDFLKSNNLLSVSIFLFLMLDFEIRYVHQGYSLKVM